MNNLSQWANVAEIFSAITVVFGVVFGVIQLMFYRRQRRDLAAIELVKTLQGQYFTASIRRVLSLPTRCTSAELAAVADDMEDAAMAVTNTFEAIGLMVHQRILRMETARDLVGGLTVGGWRRLQCWVEQQRVELERDDFGEWFQWMAERMNTLCEVDRREPAHLRELTWKQ